MNNKSILAHFSTVAILEGFSYLAFFITIPLKYIWNIFWPNKIIGMVHGVLFVLYVVYAIFVTNQKNWTIKRFVILFIASLIPFGTFYIDKKYLKPALQKTGDG